MFGVPSDKLTISIKSHQPFSQTECDILMVLYALLTILETTNRLNSSLSMHAHHCYDKIPYKLGYLDVFRYIFKQIGNKIQVKTLQGTKNLL